MANRYWVGGTGAWTDTAKWSTTSGGAGGASVPTSADSVFFDANSGSAAYSVSITTTATCGAMTVVAPTGGGTVTFTRTTTNILYCYGSVDFAASVIGQMPNATYFINTNPSTPLVVNTRNNSFYDIYFQGSGNAQINLASALNAVNGAVYFCTGSTGQAITVNTNGWVVNGYKGVIANGTDTVTVNFGSSTIYCGLGSSTGWDFRNANLTLNAGTSTVDLATISNAPFHGGGKTYYNARLQMAYACVISGTNTFNKLTLSSGGYQNDYRTFIIQNDQTIGTMEFSGSSITQRRVLLGTQHGGVTLNITAYSGTQCSHHDFFNINVVGTTLVGSNLGDGGGNSGISGFAAPRNVYWVGGTNSYIMASTTWSLTATGAAGNNYPRPQDTVYVTDYNPPSGGLVNVFWPDNIPSPTIDFSQRTLPVTALLDATVRITKSVIHKSVVTYSGATTTYIDPSSAITLGDPTGGSTMNFPGVINIGYTRPADVTLSGPLSTSSYVTLTAGTFNTNGKTLTTTSFGSSGTHVRSLILGSSAVNISGSGSTAWSVSTVTANLTINAGTSTISMTSASAKTFVGGGYTYYNVNQGGAGALTFSGSNTLNDITNTYKATASTIIFTAGTTTTLSNFTAAGTASAQLSVQSSSTTRATLSKASGTVYFNYITYTNLQAAGGATWVAALGSGNIDGGGNLGILSGVSQTLAAAALVSATATAAISKNSRLATLSAVAVSASAALAKSARLSYSFYAQEGYVADGYVDLRTDPGVSATAALSVVPQVHLAAAAVVTAAATSSLSKQTPLSASGGVVATTTAAVAALKTLAATGFSVASTVAAVSKSAPLSTSAVVECAAVAVLSKALPLEGLAGTGAVSTVAADLGVGKPLAGSGAALVAAAASVANAVSVASSVQVLASTTGAVAKSLNMTGLLSGVATAAAAAAVAKPIAANVTATSTVAAAINQVVSLVGLAGTGAITNIAPANLSLGKPIAGLGSVVATATPNVTLSKPIAASAQVLAASSGTLAKNTFVAASIQVESTTTAAASVGKPLGSSAVCLTVIQGGLSLGKPIAADAQTSADAQGNVVLGKGLSGSVQAAQEAVADVYLTKPIGGSGLTLATVNGRLIAAHLNDIELLTGTYAGVSWSPLQAVVASGEVYASAELVGGELVATAEPLELQIYRRAA